MKNIQPMKHLFFLIPILLGIFGCDTQQLVDAPEVLIESISKDSGQIGEEVIIKGLNFSTDPKRNQVDFNGTFAEVIQASNTELIVTVPELATDGIVRVGWVGGKKSVAGNFKILPSQRPVITDLKDENGNSKRLFNAGEVMIIEGRGFNELVNRNVVIFNNVLTPFSEILTVDNTFIRLIVPGNAISGSLTVNVTGRRSLPVEVTINGLDPSKDGRIYWAEIEGTVSNGGISVSDNNALGALFRASDNLNATPPGTVINAENYVRRTTTNSQTNNDLFRVYNYAFGDLDPQGEHHYSAIDNASLETPEVLRDPSKPFALRVINLKNKQSWEIPFSIENRHYNLRGEQGAYPDDMRRSRIFVREYQGKTCVIFASSRYFTPPGTTFPQNVVNIYRMFLSNDKKSIEEITKIYTYGTNLGRSGALNTASNTEGYNFMGVSKSRIFFIEKEQYPVTATNSNSPLIPVHINFEGNNKQIISFIGKTEGETRTFRSLIFNGSTDVVYFQQTARRPLLARPEDIRGNYGIYFVDVNADPTFSNPQVVYGPFDLFTQRNFLIHNPYTAQGPEIDAERIRAATFGNEYIYFVRPIQNVGDIIFIMQKNGSSFRPQVLYTGAQNRIREIFLGNSN